MLDSKLAMAQHVKDEKIMEPYLYLGQILGKNVRGILIDCFQEWISIPDDKMEIIKVSPVPSRGQVAPHYCCHQAFEWLGRLRDVILQ